MTGILFVLLVVSGATAAELSAGHVVMGPGQTKSVVISGAISGQSTFGVTIVARLVPRASAVGTVTFTLTPPVDVTQAGDPWPGAGLFTPLDTDLSSSLLMNGSVDDNGTILSTPVTYTGTLTDMPIVASGAAGGVWDVLLTTTDFVSDWEGLPTTLTAGTITVVCNADVECDDGLACTQETCESNACVVNPIDANCDNGSFCDGAETCDISLGCVQGVPPCGEDTCDEAADACRTPVAGEGTMAALATLITLAGIVLIHRQRSIDVT